MDARVGGVISSRAGAAMRFAVCCDLRLPRGNYQPLWDVLGQLGGFRVLESVWCVEWDRGAAVLRDRLAALVDRGDRLFVVDLSEWAAANALREPI